MNKPLIPLQRTALGQFDDQQFAAWTLEAHDARCRECGSPNSDSRCPAGERYADACRPDLSWIPEPRTGD